MQEELIKLGLSPNEALIFCALLESGETPSGEIIKKTGKHRNIVYESLDNLKKRDLVKETIKRGKKYFKVGNPEVLSNRAKDQFDLAAEVASEIKAKGRFKAPQINIYEGREGWQTAYRRVMKDLKRGDKIYTIGAGGDKWVEAMGNLFLSYENFLKEKKIILSMIAFSWQRKEIEEHQSNFSRTTKYLPEKYLVPANTEIFKDRIFIQIYTAPLILIEIINKELALGYLQYFQTFWKIAKK